MTTDNELHTILEEYKTHILLVHRDAPNTLEGQTGYFARGKKQAKLALTRLIEAEKVKARVEGLREAKQIVIRRTEIPADAKNPTRDQTVIIGEACAEAINYRLAQLSHPKERTEG